MADQQILPFYGHSRGQYREFSNFYWHDVPYSFVLPEYARQSWTPTEIQCQYSEKAIMAIKASLFDDQETFWLIDKSYTPDDTKALGRKVRNFKEDVWSKHLEQTAFEVVYQKFTTSKYLKQLLLETGNQHIVEAAPSDRIWGVGLSKSDPKIWDPKQWRGTNVLGNALMQARKKLKADQSGSQRSAMDQKVLPFYGHSRGEYREFSNFYWHDVPYSFVLPEYARQSWTPKEIQCEYSEKAIMAIKASLFDDQETFWLIDKSCWPDDTKALGREVRNFQEDVWSKHLEQTAFEVVYQKFTTTQYLKQLLLKTGNQHIVEAAPYDCIWGVGLSRSDPKIWDPKQWQGKNVLGNALMQARDKLREEQSPVQSVAGSAFQEPAKKGTKRARWTKKGAVEPASEAAP